jgi:hypothetical protein
MSEETHYGLIRPDNTIMNVYWYETLEAVKEKLENYNKANAASGYNHPTLRVVAVQILEGWG